MNDTTNVKINPSDELNKAIAEQQKLAEKIEALRKETREADLATVKKLCELHSFFASDLKGSLKIKGATRTPRKSTTQRRKKT